MRSSWAIINLSIALIPLCALVAWKLWVVDVLIVGLVTVDVFSDRSSRLGGAVSYAAEVATGLGVRACVVTATADDVDLGFLQRQILHLVPSNKTLTFEHSYNKKGVLWWSTYDRHLRVDNHNRPRFPLISQHVPFRCRFARTVLLGPLMPDDVDARSFTMPSHPLLRYVGRFQRVGLMAQGFQRGLASDGSVVSLTKPSPALRDALTKQTTLFLSDVETDPWSQKEFEEIVNRADSVVVTRGAAGATVFTAGSAPVHVPVRRVNAVDTNGAGDTFAAAWMFAELVGAGTPGDFAAWVASRVCLLEQACKPNCVSRAIAVAVASEGVKMLPPMGWRMLVKRSVNYGQEMMANVRVLCSRVPVYAGWTSLWAVTDHNDLK